LIALVAIDDPGFDFVEQRVINELIIEFDGHIVASKLGSGVHELLTFSRGGFDRFWDSLLGSGFELGLGVL